MKVNQNDNNVNTGLYLGTNFLPNKLLYQGVHNLIKYNPAKIIFGERIKASFKEPTYTLTLNNLEFNDKNTLTLLVISEKADTLLSKQKIGKSDKVSTVTGMHFLLP